jgi:two-component system CheB/CheR fusion protein
MKAIKEHGGVLMAQSPEEAEYDTMPRSAIATGLVDFVLPAAALAAKLLELRQHDRPARLPASQETLPQREEDALHQILTQVQAHTGHDFRSYKPATVLRRIARRMRVVQVETLAAYLGVLRAHPPEAQALLKDLLISVTMFFRDAEAFAALQEQVLPGLVADKPPGEALRVWVPGCATGEEAYSLAILLLEQADTLPAPPPLQLFASDLDEEALTYARAGLYPGAIAADLSDERLQRFFVPEGAFYRVTKALRDTILFVPHNLLKDPPFARLDLLSCRNLLIYLQRDLQEQVAALFHYALRPEGALFLGNAESLDGVTALFRAVDTPHRLYRPVPFPAHGPARLPTLPLLGRLLPARPRPVSPQQAASDAQRHRQALETHAPPSLLVDAEANIVHVSETANRYLQFPSGSPSPNLYRAALPELRLELRTALYRALEKGEATLSAPIPVEMRGTRRLVQLYVTPTTRAPAPPMALVVFAEAGLPASALPPADAPDDRGADPRLRPLEEELEAVKAQLQGTIEAAEVQQEDLKAANEELQSINEEYKSTLEELETSKEELQSINEELTTVNHELQDRLQDLRQANENLQNLMAATDVAVLFVDRQLTIQLYTPPLAQLFHILPVDRGRPLAHVTHRLATVPFLRDIQQVLETRVPLEREVTRDDGRAYLMRLVPYPTTADRADGVVVTFIDITPLKQAEQQVRERAEQFQALIEASAQTVWTTDAVGRVVEDAPSWRAFTGQTSAERRGWGWLDAVHPEDRAGVETTWRQGVAAGLPIETECRLRHISGAWRWTAMRAVPLRDADGGVRGWVGMHTDITARKQAEEARHALTTTLEQRVAELQQAHTALRHESSERQHMQETLFQREKLAALGTLLANVAHELNNPLAVAAMQLDNLQEAGGPDAWTEDLETLRQAVERCSRVVQGFLALARQQPPSRSAVALHAIIDDVLVLLRRPLEVDDIPVQLHLADDVPPLWADATQLHHVVANLLTNAYHALRQTAPPRHLTLTTAVNAAHTEVTLAVADSGPGIPEDVQRRVFEPFFTTKAGAMGSGLGLPLCRNIVEGHGGTIRLVSQPGQGTTVSVTLPVAAPDVPAVEASPAAVTPAETQHGTILLIDDEPGIHRALTQLLRRSGYAITTAANGQEGLAALEARPYDLILCDMRMPDLDGPAFYRELARRHPPLLSRVIFLTGDVLSPEAQAFFAEVHRPHLIKPFKAQEVRQLIQQVLAAQ